MDAYLAMAEKVLREARQPLGAREILRRAYPSGKMPSHLHGKTQHKTLGARLAEDILERGDRSTFFRNGPGRYFLTEFIGDDSIPIEHRRRFVARRRRRQLAQAKPLAFHKSDLPAARNDGSIPIDAIFDLIIRGNYHYPKTTKAVGPADVIVWSFVIVSRGRHILTYRHGEYREQRDAFRHRRAIGFYAPVLEGDRTLFDLEDHGIIHRGMNTISIDLGMTTSIDLDSVNAPFASLDCFVYPPGNEATALLSVIRFEAPDWFEPYARKLAINDLEWMDFAIPRNHAEDLDPWSSAVLTAALEVESSRSARRG